jgi:hypothetical protein
MEAAANRGLTYLSADPWSERNGQQDVHPAKSKSKHTRTLDIHVCGRGSASPWAD